MEHKRRRFINRVFLPFVETLPLSEFQNYSTRKKTETGAGTEPSLLYLYYIYLHQPENWRCMAFFIANTCEKCGIHFENLQLTIPCLLNYSNVRKCGHELKVWIIFIDLNIARLFKSIQMPCWTGGIFLPLNKRFHHSKTKIAQNFTFKATKEEGKI